MSYSTNPQKAVVGGFADVYYWSSTEADATIAWLQSFESGPQYGSGKSNAYFVRAISSF